MDTNLALNMIEQLRMELEKAPKEVKVKKIDPDVEIYYNDFKTKLLKLAK